MPDQPHCNGIEPAFVPASSNNLAVCSPASRSGATNGLMPISQPSARPMLAAGRPQVEPWVANDAEKILEEARERASKAVAKQSASARGVESAVQRAASVALGKVTVISDEESQRRSKFQQEMEKGTRLKILLEAACIPERYALAELDDVSRLPADVRPHWQAKAQQVLEILDSDSVHVMCGERGPGKTHMACGLIRECVRRGKSARYAKLNDYVNDIKSCFGTGRDVRAVEREWRAPFLLVLDEEQERFGSNTEHIYITRLIDLRYDAMRPTLLISNQAADALEASLGASIVSRASDGGGVIQCDWGSVRGRLLKGKGQPVKA